MAARGMDDGCLSQQALSWEAGRASHAWLAGDSVKTGQCASANSGAWALCWLRQQGQQLPFPGSPVLIFFHSLTGGSNLVGRIKEKFRCDAEFPHILVLDASFLQ